MVFSSEGDWDWEGSQDILQGTLCKFGTEKASNWGSQQIHLFENYNFSWWIFSWIFYSDRLYFAQFPTYPHCKVLDPIQLVMAYFPKRTRNGVLKNSYIFRVITLAMIGGCWKFTLTYFDVNKPERQAIQSVREVLFNRHIIAH